MLQLAGSQPRHSSTLSLPSVLSVTLNDVIWCCCLQFFVRDILGMAGGIMFAYAAGSNFDSNAKQWRLFADIMNDVGKPCGGDTHTLWGRAPLPAWGAAEATQHQQCCPEALVVTVVRCSTVQ